MNEQTNSSWIKVIIDWMAATLGIGTFMGVVNVGVGLLSGMWLAYQLYCGFKYDLPLKRAKLKAAQAGEFTKPGDLQ